jgi:hypothetical protein
MARGVVCWKGSGRSGRGRWQVKAGWGSGREGRKNGWKRRWKVSISNVMRFLSATDRACPNRFPRQERTTKNRKSGRAGRMQGRPRKRSDARPGGRNRGRRREKGETGDWGGRLGRLRGKKGPRRTNAHNAKGEGAGGSHCG